MIRVMVVFGGRSGEHEVSLASATAILETLGENELYEVLPVGITREGRWLMSGDPMKELQSAAGSSGEADLPAHSSEKLPDGLDKADVVFPVLHGPFGEDGTVQGMLEMAGIPYVGSGVLASAVAMDKVTMKKVFAYHGLPQVRWLGFTRAEWEADSGRWTQEIENSFGYPCFVKPSNLGSSVGIERVATESDLRGAVETAARLDRRIIVEEEVEAREIEVAVLGNENPEVSVPGEIVLTQDGFYDYDAKYAEGGMDLAAPAMIPEVVTEEIRRVARAAYEAVDAAGMARIDFFLERGTDRLLLNEINTIPGFTPTSVYSRLWAASGVEYGELLGHLIQLALERHG